MPIKRCKDQSNTNQTLVAFYKKLQQSDEPVSKNIGTHMLQLLAKFDTIFIESNIYALTSLFHTVLLSNDTWKSQWVLKFISNGKEFIITEIDEETHKFTKETTFYTQEELITYILNIMRQSGYWNDIPELK
jgi:hypothetical protein